jgi:hypothetical protein
MTRKMTYKALMTKVDDGDAQIDAWAQEANPDGSCDAQVTLYKANGTATRATVTVTQIPTNL